MRTTDSKEVEAGYQAWLKHDRSATLNEVLLNTDNHRYVDGAVRWALCRLLLCMDDWLSVQHCMYAHSGRWHPAGRIVDNLTPDGQRHGRQLITHQMQFQPYMAHCRGWPRCFPRLGCCVLRT